MQNAVNKAIEGGYKPDTPCMSKMCLDPLFWQALGRQQGWGSNEVIASNGGFNLEVPSLEWIIKWHSFIDEIAEGMFIDEFFNQLIK